MNSEYDEIYGLIVRSFSGHLTEEEKVQLSAWRNLDKANAREYDDYLAIWNQSAGLSGTLTGDTEKELETIQKKVGTGSRQVNWMTILQRIAAVLLVAVVINVLVEWLRSGHEPLYQSVVYQTAKSTYGTQTRVDLSDGTVVWLNSGSTLRYPDHFSGMASRKVELNGEGSFQVAPNKKIPFIVEIGKYNIVVTGTTFNVDAYQGDQYHTIALLEGSVKLSSQHGTEPQGLAELRPNDVAVINQATGKVSVKKEKDLTKYISWKEGKIVFVNDPVTTVMQKLGNWYNVDISFSGKVLERYRFTATFIDEPLEQVLNILNLTSHMRYTMTPAQKQADNSYTKRKIILSSQD